MLKNQKVTKMTAELEFLIKMKMKMKAKAMNMKMKLNMNMNTIRDPDLFILSFFCMSQRMPVKIFYLFFRKPKNKPLFYLKKLKNKCLKLRRRQDCRVL